MSEMIIEFVTLLLLGRDAFWGRHNIMGADVEFIVGWNIMKRALRLERGRATRC